MSAEARLAVIEEKLDAGDKRMNSIEGKLDSLVAAQLKQRGFIAGFSSAISLLMAAVIAVVTYVWKHYTA